MTFDPCAPPVSYSAASAPPSPLHRLARHVGSRHFHRLHHVHSTKATVPQPAYSCGKHFADDHSGNLAARPTDSTPAPKAVGGKAAAAKLAAGGTAALLAAATVTGALALPSGGGLVPFSGLSPQVSPQGVLAPYGSAATTPGSESQPLSAVKGLVPTSAASATAQVATPVPEPSSLALLAGFASLTPVARLLRRIGRRTTKSRLA